MNEHEIKFFNIIHLDSLGQGIAKSEDQIYFLLKVLPGESGTAIVKQKKKKLNFGYATTIDQSSIKRIPAQCEHYQHCHGCHYQHCSYEDELAFKRSGLEQMVKQFLKQEIKIHSHQAQSRQDYRNRIQLHYSINEKKLGYINPIKSEIVEVSQCLLPTAKIKETMNQLYNEDHWLELAKSQNLDNGHVEIYELNGQVYVQWNKRYAEPGFSQVNEEMNLKLKDVVKNICLKYITTNRSVVELFSGDGNLTSNLNNCYQFYHFDYDVGLKKNNPRYWELDLFKDTSIKKIIELLRINQIYETDIILDPPRSGYSHLCEIANQLKSQIVVYISCNPATMLRDIANCNQYQVKELHLIDLFPSTYHFETVAILQKK